MIATSDGDTIYDCWADDDTVWYETNAIKGRIKAKGSVIPDHLIKDELASFL